MPASLPSTIVAHRRGAWAGRLDDLALGGGLSGWACPVPPEAAQAPLQVRLVIEDLLRPGCSWPLAVVSAALQRDDLEQEGLDLTCGFNLPGPLPLDLPPRSTGTVLRAFLDTPEGVVELSGSPQRLNPERYRQLERLQRRGAGDHRGGLHALEGPLVHGWGAPSTTLNLLLDGQPCLELRSDPQGRICGVLPASACDGRPHQLELRDRQGHSLDQRLIFTPFQITPWPALLAQSCPPFQITFIHWRWSSTEA